MTYYINPMWFYMVNAVDSIRTAFIFIIAAIVILILIQTVIAVSDISSDGRKYCIDNGWKYNEYGEHLRDELHKGLKKWISIVLIMTSIVVLIPSRQTCIQMMVASLATKENTSNVKQEIYDIVDYISTNLSKED